MMFVKKRIAQPRWYRRTVFDSLDHLEVLISKIGDGTRPEPILSEMDDIRARLDVLPAQGRTSISGEAQFEYIGKLLKKSLAGFLKDIGGSNGMVALRATRQPEPRAWWWFLDELYAEKQKAIRKRKLIWLSSGIVASLLMVLIYQLIQPNPATLRRFTYEDEIQSDLTHGEYSNALMHANQGLITMPGDEIIITMKGIAQIRLGDTIDGAQSLAMAQKLAKNPETYLVQRGLIYLRIEDWKSVAQDGQAIVQINPQSAEGYFLLGTAYGKLQNSKQAYRAFANAEKYAKAQGNNELLLVIQMNRLDLPPDPDRSTSQPNSPNP